MNLHSEYTGYYLFIGLPLALLFTYVLYRNNPLKLESPYKNWYQALLFSLRFSALAILLILFLGYWLNWIRIRTDKPVLAFALDNSQSILASKDSTFYKQELPQQFQQMKEQLSDKFDLRFFLFGNANRLSQTPEYTDNRTDIASAIQEITTSFEGTNLGGIVLFSDGIYNEGVSPVVLSDQIICPVYTVAMGDTNRYKDTRLKNATYNKTVFAGNPITVRFDIAAFKCRDEQSELVLLHNNTQVRRERIQFSADPYFKTYTFTAASGKEGLQHYSLVLQPLKGESSVTNNRLDFSIQVVKNKQKIGIVGSQPHPDLAALRSGIKNNEQYELVDLGLNASGLDRSISLIIAHQIPGLRGEGLDLIREAQKHKIPVLFILGAQSGLSYLPALTNNQFYILNNRPVMNEVMPVINPGFTYFNLEEEDLHILQKFPPLIAPHGRYKTGGEVTVMFYQQIGMVSSDIPLLLFYSQNQIKYGVLCGEGFWKWKLNDFTWSKQQTTQSLLNKTLQYLVEKNDRSPFRIIAEKQVDESDNVQFDAELYNASNELVNTPDPVLKITHQNGKTYAYTFNKTDHAYTLNAGQFTPGTYSWQASVQFGDKSYQSGGQFMVQPARIEFLETTANHQVLHALSESTGGEMVYPAQLEKLTELIHQNAKIVPVSYQQEELINLMHLKLIFWILSGVLTLEWVIRKWNGSI
ncbi:MAG: hypothetical protein WC760_03165 [Bacteroidia bacterium]